MKRKIKMNVKKMFFYLNIFAMNLMMGIPVYATENEKVNKIMNSSLVQGVIALLEDLQGAALAVEAVLVVVLLIYTKIKEQAADDDEAPKYKKRFKGIMISGIVIVSLTALVPIVLSYFVVTPKNV